MSYFAAKCTKFDAPEDPLAGFEGSYFWGKRWGGRRKTGEGRGRFSAAHPLCWSLDPLLVVYGYMQGHQFKLFFWRGNLSASTRSRGSLTPEWPKMEGLRSTAGVGFLRRRHRAPHTSPGHKRILGTT